jgi:hypothetical protein
MPMLDLFWTTLILFSWGLWFVMLFKVYGDLFGRADIGGWAKTGWVVFTLFLPFLGVFTYLISQGRGMAERSARAYSPRRPVTVGPPASVPTEAEQLAEARDLLQSGAITPDEYRQMVPSPRA